MNILTQFASEQAANGGGLAVLGINLQGFLFQLITFVMVLLLLHKFVYGKLVNTLEERRKAVIDSLDNAKEAALELEKTNEKTAEMMKKARESAQEVVAIAQKEAAQTIETATAKASKKVDHMIEQAQSRIESQTADAKLALEAEMIGLVARATEKVIGEKITTKSDGDLIKKALKDTK